MNSPAFTPFKEKRKSLLRARRPAAGRSLRPGEISNWRRWGAALGTVLALIAGGTLAKGAGATSWTYAVPTQVGAEGLEGVFRRPPETARPWVYWYWMYAAVSREGISADLKAMKAAGVEGAYLMPIKGALQPPLMAPPVTQLTPAWWDCVKFAFREADRLGIKLAMHAADGFAVAGGPWITPELSMQKVVWAKAVVDGGRSLDLALPRPPTVDGYYRDIAVFAYPAPDGAGLSTRTLRPRVTIGAPGKDPGRSATADFLPNPAVGTPGPYGTYDHEPLFTSKRPCWIEYAFNKPFTCRSVTILTIGQASYWANRSILQTSDDGVHFQDRARIDAPRHGWEDWDAGVTHALPALTARYFRFVYLLQGGAIGSEDLDSAKWKPVLKLRGLILSSEAKLDDYEGKSGAVWRISPATTAEQDPAALCVPPSSVIDVSKHVDAAGHLAWNAPSGRWVILRMGHTTTGHQNETGGGGKGLECDKFNPKAARVQFDHWFGAAITEAGPELSGRVLKIFHVDSWECGSQNWSPVFRREFAKRRGYDPLPYLPAMAGVPIGSPEISERFLHDVRATIAELVVDNFFGTLAGLAHEHGCVFSAESVAPTFASDGMAHFADVDIPMGEFWLRSPTHDKLNDVLDAVSGARMYDRPVAQSEAFTEIHLGWDETPAMLKPLADRNYAFGMNRYVYHVFAHNPWTDRRPGMTLNGVGTFLQRDQVWWRNAKAWTDYCSRCDALLQQGHAASDIAVFTGENIPRRAIVPWRLQSTLPGMIDGEHPPSSAGPTEDGKNPAAPGPGSISGRIREPGHWIDPLHGYAYDSINRDALLRLARVENGRIVLPGGASYRLLIIPAADPMNPAPGELTPELATRLVELARGGATILIGARPTHSPSLAGYPQCDQVVARDADRLWPKSADSPLAEPTLAKPAVPVEPALQVAGEGKRDSRAVATFHHRSDGQKGGNALYALGMGRIFDGPFDASTFKLFGIAPDLLARDADGIRAENLAWTHRRGSNWDLYFISNQNADQRDILISLRAAGRAPELWDPVTGNTIPVPAWNLRAGRTEFPVHFTGFGSLFVVFRRAADASPFIAPEMPAPTQAQEPFPSKQSNAAKTRHAARRRPPPGPFTPLFQAVSEPIVAQTISSGNWTVGFDAANGGPKDPVVFDTLGSWTDRPEPGIRFYSGTATYRRSFDWPSDRPHGEHVWLDLGNVANLAAVRLNGVDCGVAWTPPYRVEVTPALHAGVNRLEIAVSNTWFNRLAGDSPLPQAQRLTWTTGPYPRPGAPLLPAGLLGPVTLETEAAPVSQTDMRRVYDAVKTPFKYGPILSPAAGELYDCPSVFRHGGHWYMIFVSMKGKTGYQTRLARSDDLLHWTIQGTILPFSGTGWDRCQADGGAALVDTTWGGSEELESYGGEYWLTYIGGAKPGYEPDPLSIGLATTRAPDQPAAWTRWSGNPVLGPDDPGTRPWERATLYKSQVIWDRTRTLGHPFVMYYNGKQQGPWIERIGMAVSDDMVHWQRYNADPVVDNHRGISGDPQIVRMGELWVMFYFGAGWGFGGHAFDTFACSRDLVHWTKWTGPNLIQPSEAFDATFAHKPWVLLHDGVVYHFYCCVNRNQRTIAVATSRDLGHPATP